MTFDSHGRRVVDEHTLVACWRERMHNDPVHQNRIRQETPHGH